MTAVVRDLCLAVRVLLGTKTWTRANTTLTGLAAGVPMGTLNVLVNASRPSRTSTDIRWRDHGNDVAARRMRNRLRPERA